MLSQRLENPQIGIWKQTKYSRPQSRSTSLVVLTNIHMILVPVVYLQLVFLMHRVLLEILWYQHIHEACSIHTHCSILLKRHKSRFWLAKYLVESFCVFLAACALTPFHPEGPQRQSALQGQQTHQMAEIQWIWFTGTESNTAISVCITCHKKSPLDTALEKTALNCTLKSLLISFLTYRINHP